MEKAFSQLTISPRRFNIEFNLPLIDYLLYTHLDLDAFVLWKSTCKELYHNEEVWQYKRLEVMHHLKGPLRRMKPSLALGAVFLWRMSQELMQIENSFSFRQTNIYKQFNPLQGDKKKTWFQVVFDWVRHNSSMRLLIQYLIHNKVFPQNKLEYVFRNQAPIKWQLVADRYIEDIF